MNNSKLDSYLKDAELLDFGSKHYPEIRFGYGPISSDDRTPYFEMISILKELFIKHKP